MLFGHGGLQSVPKRRAVQRGKLNCYSLSNFLDALSVRTCTLNSSSYLQSWLMTQYRLQRHIQTSRSLDGLYSRFARISHSTYTQAAFLDTVKPTLPLSHNMSVIAKKSQKPPQAPYATKVSDMAAWLRGAGICQGRCESHFQSLRSMIPSQAELEPQVRSDLMGCCLTSSMKLDQGNDTLRKVTGVSDPAVNEAIMSPSPRAPKPVPLYQRLEQWIDQTISDTFDTQHAPIQEPKSEPTSAPMSVYGKIEEPENGGSEEIKEVVEEPTEDGQRLSEDFTLIDCGNEDWPAPLIIRKSSKCLSPPTPRPAVGPHKRSPAPSGRDVFQACAQSAASLSFKEAKAKGKVPQFSDLTRRPRVKFSSTSQLPRINEKDQRTFAVANLNKPLPPLPWQRLVSASLEDVRFAPLPEVYQPTNLGRVMSLSRSGPSAPNVYRPRAIPRSQSLSTFDPSSSLSAQHQPSGYNPANIKRSQSMTKFARPLPAVYNPTQLNPPPSPTLLLDYALATEQIHNLERIDSVSLMDESTVSSIRIFAQRKGIAGLGVAGRSSFPMKRKTSLLRKVSARSLRKTKAEDGPSTVTSSFYSREVDGTLNGEIQASTGAENDEELGTGKGLRLRKLESIARKAGRRVARVRKHLRWRRQAHQ